MELRPPPAADGPIVVAVVLRGANVALEAFVIIHGRLATSVLLYMAAVGLWGLVRFLRGGSLNGSIAGAMVIGQALIVVQVVAGLVLLAGGWPPPESVHYLYGATAVVVLPFVWSFFRDRDQRQALLISSLLMLFIAGLAIRGMTTAG